jgi:hypothetical protein
VLLTLQTLRGIEEGEITLAFRRWRRPTVKSGGRLRTRIGELAIHTVEPATLQSITAKDAHRAGFASRAALLALLRGREGAVYRIRLSLAGEDPRIALRANDKLSADELQSIRTRLDRMDARSKDGPWTATVLELIKQSPATLAADLAASIGMAKAPFKARVRRLKELGLTESLKVGYRLSPRGKRVHGHRGSGRS